MKILVEKNRIFVQNMCMFDCFLAQMLVLAMSFFCSARIFFLKSERLDSFAIFAPLSFAASVLIFVCFDFSLPNLAVFFVALITAVTNFRAVLRLKARLIVDHYGTGFVIFSLISIILAFSAGYFLVVFRPVKYSPADFNVIRTQKTLTGNSNNLKIRENFWSGERFSGNLYIYEPIVHDEINAEIYSENPVLIFAHGIRANVQNYEPYLMLLAQKGYKVISADFYCKDLQLISQKTENFLEKNILESKFFRRFFALFFEIQNSDEFSKILESEKSLMIKKYSALTRLALEIFGDETKFYYITDNLDFDSIYKVIDEFNTEPYSNAKGFFAMNRVEEYKSSGYGFIEQTDIFLAEILGIERENKFFIPRYVANKTIEATR